MNVVNLFARIPTAHGEEFLELASLDGVRIERIVSNGEGTGEWYDQDWHEWVIVLEGSAELEMNDRTIGLARGDALLIPAHCRHRVIRTSTPTIWLAVHWPAALANLSAEA